MLWLFLFLIQFAVWLVLTLFFLRAIGVIDQSDCKLLLNSCYMNVVCFMSTLIKPKTRERLGMKRKKDWWKGRDVVKEERERLVDAFAEKLSALACLTYSAAEKVRKKNPTCTHSRLQQITCSDTISSDSRYLHNKAPFTAQRAWDKL